jgi:hypothetical protein
MTLLATRLAKVIDNVVLAHVFACLVLMNTILPAKKAPTS